MLMLRAFLESSDFTDFDYSSGTIPFRDCSLHLYQQYRIVVINVLIEYLMPLFHIYSPQTWRGVSMTLSCCTQMQLTIQSTEVKTSTMARLS